jgi:hypothetical protein
VVDIAENTRVLANKAHSASRSRRATRCASTRCGYRELTGRSSLMLEEEGIYAWFDHEGGTALVSDNSVAAPHTRRRSAGPLQIHESGMHSQHRADRRARERSRWYRRGSPSPRSIRSARFPMTSDGPGALEIYTAPGGVNDAGDLRGLCRTTTKGRGGAGSGSRPRDERAPRPRHGLRDHRSLTLRRSPGATSSPGQSSSQ